MKPKPPVVPLPYGSLHHLEEKVNAQRRLACPETIDHVVPARGLALPNDTADTTDTTTAAVRRFPRPPKGGGLGVRLLPHTRCGTSGATSGTWAKAFAAKGS